MGKIVARGVVKRKQGMLYYVDKQGNVGEAKMKSGGTRGHKTCSSAKLKRKAAKKKAAPKKKAATKKRAVKKAAHHKKKHHTH